MYHLRLCKARSYFGIVQATQKRPDVYVPEKEQGESLVNSGYFVLVEDGAVSMDGATAETDNSAGSGEGEVDLLGDGAEDESQEDPVIAELQTMTKAQLVEYAGKDGIDITGCKTKDDIFSKIIEAIARADAARAALREE